MKMDIPPVPVALESGSGALRGSGHVHLDFDPALRAELLALNRSGAADQVKIGISRTISDAGYYIGACQQRCDQTINLAHAEFNAVGYSGTNSGGQIVIKNSEFNDNQDGFDTDSENGDAPSPQNGACPTPS